MSGEIQFSALTAADAACVFDLYQRVVATTKQGFLSEKNMSDMLAILACAGRSASVGAWSDGRLVAYALCALETGNVFLQSPLISLVRGRGEPLWIGKGVVVDPQFEGRLLMSRLLARRYDFMRKHSAICHSAGMIAVDNIPSLTGALRVGSWLVGLEDDQHCKNFVCYGGALIEAAIFGEECVLDIDDIEGLSSRFGGGWIGTKVALNRVAKKRQITLRQVTFAGQSIA